HNGDYAKIEARWLQNGTLRHDTIQLQFYHPRIDTLYGHSQFILNWKSNKWGTIANPDGDYILTDSPVGNYEDSDSNFIQLNKPIDVVKARNVSLDFWTRWSIEAKLDFGVVEVSENDGRSWVRLKSTRMKPATGLPSSKQETGTYGFDGNFPVWVRQECNLDAYIGKKILIRFGLLSDEQGTHDGMFLKDISLRTYDDTMSGVNSEIQHAAHLDIFPSPTTGDVVYISLTKNNAQLPSNSTYTLKMSNALGEECYSVTGETSGGNEHIVSIPTSGRASGVYRISMQFDGQVLNGACVILK
ncbi:MAG: immune inhibitor A, partial [Ignavibacteriae bacterium]|nr:immune inhibitor A [Ignavibacteriota bacterium]